MITMNALKALIVETPPIECNFRVGDKVTFTNDQGVVFPGHTIIGFDSVDAYAKSIMPWRFIYIDYDCYWFPVKPENLTLDGR